MQNVCKCNGGGQGCGRSKESKRCQHGMTDEEYDDATSLQKVLLEEKCQICEGTGQMILNKK